MTYNIYHSGELKAVCKHSMDAVAQCNDYTKAGHEDVLAFEVTLSGEEKPYDWYRDYLDLCYGAY